MCEQLELDTDTNFEPISVAAEAVVSRLAKARFRALAGDRYGLIKERRRGDGRTQHLNPSPPVKKHANPLA